MAETKDDLRQLSTLDLFELLQKASQEVERLKAMNNDLVAALEGAIVSLESVYICGISSVRKREEAKIREAIRKAQSNVA